MNTVCGVLLTTIFVCTLTPSVLAVESVKETDLYSFCTIKNCGDGEFPLGSLISASGILYGTTEYGGDYRGGTVFALDLDTNAETVLHSFCGRRCADGETPVTGLVAVSSVLYGATAAGGVYRNRGTLFSLNPTTGAEVILHFFGKGADGAYPNDLIGAKEWLYGTTISGGAPRSGTVFAFDLCSGTERVLYAFCSVPPNCSDGSVPHALLVGPNGIFYGTTNSGGNTGCNCGTAFSFDQRTNTETVLHAFSGGADGEGPEGNLIDLNGTLYGTTFQGGTYDRGTVFSLDTATETETVLHSFGGGTDGSAPEAGLTDVNGTLYGTTSAGGSHGGGTVYSIDPTSGEETVLYSFPSGPHAGLTAANGSLYGTTYQGGTESRGSVFALKSFDLNTSPRP